MFHRLWIAIVGVMVIIVSACSPEADSPVQVEHSRAVVESVELVQVIGRPGSQLALVRGTLPDSCARLGNAVVSPGGRLMVVILPQIRTPGGGDCAPGPIAYERTVSLGADLAPGQYTVSVNGVQATFDLQGAPDAQAAAQAPAPIPTLPVNSNLSPTDAPVLATLAADPTPEPGVREQESAIEAPGQPAAAAPEAQPSTGVGAVPEPTLIPMTSGKCEDKAAFSSDVSVPDGTLFEPGEKFTKTWRIRNVGTCTWEGYALVFQQGDRMGSPDPSPIFDTVKPGQEVEISLELTAPQAPGSYFSDWLFLNDRGSSFGLGNPPVGLLWTKVGVRALLPPGGPVPACAYMTDPSVEAEILSLINQARQERNLKPLKLVDALSTAARDHSQDMGCNDFVDHYAPDGRNWYKRIQTQGIKYKDASENIYAGNPQFGGTAQGAFNWWMNSQIHRDNILNPKSEQIGIGYIFADSSQWKGYYTLNFVQP